MDSFNQILDAVKEYCRASVPEAAYKLSFKGLETVSFDVDKAVLSTATDFIKNIVQNRYLSLIKEGFESILGYDIDIEIVARDAMELDKQEEQRSAENEKKSFEKTYTFDNFIRGGNNEAALAAALNVAENPGTKINPLYIYGSSGLGKTHLLKAIQNYINKNMPYMNVVYVGCEQFTNDFVNSIRFSTQDSFREKYRTADVLLVDDIQFIAGKEGFQEEFFYTFNSLHEEKKQIVIASDRSPKEIKSLEERLRTRFEWGVMQDVQSPDIETRISIILSKADALGIKISNEIAEYIAKHLTSNIRQLEGAVNKIYARHLMDGNAPTLESAKLAIQDMENEAVPVTSTAEKIISEVARTFNVSSEDITGPKQKADVSNARQISMHIVREVTGMTMEKIGELFNRNHATVVYAIDKVEKKISSDQKTREIVQDIIKNCQQ